MRIDFPRRPALASGPATTATPGARGGFTMIEVLVAMVILGIALLGTQALIVDRLVRDIGEIDVRTAASQLVRNRIEIIRSDPQYDQLVTRYQGTETDPRGFDGFTRITTVTRSTGYTTVTVRGVTPLGRDTVSRTVVVGAP